MLLISYQPLHPKYDFIALYQHDQFYKSKPYAVQNRLEDANMILFGNDERTCLGITKTGRFAAVLLIYDAKTFRDQLDGKTIETTTSTPNQESQQTEQL